LTTPVPDFLPLDLVRAPARDLPDRLGMDRFFELKIHTVILCEAHPLGKHLIAVLRERAVSLLVFVAYGILVKLYTCRTFDSL